MALYDLRLDEEVFWALTPREFDLLVERWALDQERSDRRFAGVSKILVEVNSTKRSRKYKLEEFMVHDFTGSIHTKPIQTVDEQRRVLQQFKHQFDMQRAYAEQATMQPM